MTFHLLMVVVVSRVEVFTVYTHDRVLQRLVKQNNVFPAATAEQIVDTPVPRGGRQDPDLPSAASSSGLPGMANQEGVSPLEKVLGWVRTWGRNWVRTSAHPRRRLSWWVSSRMQLVVCGCSSLMFGGNFWARIQKYSGLGDGWDGALVMRQPTDALR